VRVWGSAWEPVVPISTCGVEREGGCMGRAGLVLEGAFVGAGVGSAWSRSISTCGVEREEGVHVAFWTEGPWSSSPAG
jgi:hypothetical protein